MRRELNIERKNVPGSGRGDLYFRLMRLRLASFFGLAFFLFLLINLAYGCLYFLLRPGLHPAGASFSQCFFLSVQTFSTVGYGTVTPVSTTAQLLALVETFNGIVSIALLTGILFAKFSQPSARMLFSQPLLATKHQGKDALLFRVANVRPNRVMDALVSLTALHTEISPEGIRYRRIEELPLERGHTPVFNLSLLGAHFVDSHPKTKVLLERLAKGENIEFIASIRGHDETFGQTVHASHLYRPADMKRGGQFRDILEVRDDGTRIIDFAQFHETRE